MAKAKLKDRLAAAQKMYSGAESKSEGGSRLPPGQGYIGTIHDAFIEAIEDDILRVTWPITVTSPDKFEGAEHRDWSRLANENNMSYFKGRLELLEVDIPDDFEDIGEALKETDGKQIRFDVVRVDEYTNTYFRELVVPDEDEGSRKKSKSKAEEEEPEEPEHTRKELGKLGRKADKDDDDSIEAIEELEKAAKSVKLEPDDYAEWADLADAIADELGL